MRVCYFLMNGMVLMKRHFYCEKDSKRYERYCMNYWTRLSMEFANQRNYLDELFRIYPTIPDGIRDINEEHWNQIERFL